MKFHVDIIHRSEQVELYKLSAGQKEMVFEKRLLVKSQKWRLLSINYKMEEVTEHTVRDMHKIWNLIDEHISSNTISTYRLPHERSA